MESLVTWFTIHLSEYISREAIVFVISLMPILELRGGLLAASLLQVPITTAIPICVVGNILPIPFILLFIKNCLKKVLYLRQKLNIRLICRIKVG